MEIRSCARNHFRRRRGIEGPAPQAGVAFVASAAFAAALYNASGAGYIVTGTIGALIKRTNPSPPRALTRAPLGGNIFFEVEPAKAGTACGCDIYGMERGVGRDAIGRQPKAAARTACHTGVWLKRWRSLLT